MKAMKAIGRREWRWALTVAVLAVGLSTTPYAYASLTTPPALHFSGLLVNAYDGYSYLAKMQQGAHGEWLFHLPFTPEPHQGGLIFTFYLALGHLAAALGLPLILVFHLARIAAGLGLLLVGYAFIAHFSDNVRERRVAFVLLAFSSGLGWLVAASGESSIDLSIPEAITFYSLAVNPHFPLALALLLVTFLGILTPLPDGRSLDTGRVALLVLAPLALVAIQPFVFITLVGVLGLYLAWQWLAERPHPLSSSLQAWGEGVKEVRVEVIRVALALTAATPVVVYDYWLLTMNPVMRAWTAQNATPSPPPWDYLLGYGLVLVLAVPGAWQGLRRGDRGTRFLVAWVAATALLLYAPFALQRRLSLGLHVPLAILAGQGICRVLASRLRRQRWLTAGLVGATTLTNLALLLVLFGGAARHAPLIYLHDDEWTALGWLRQNVSAGAVVLAGPETGAFIPALAGQRVVYGHPFETIDARARLAEVEDYFAGRLDAPAQVALLRREGVSWVWLGPRERAIGQDGAGPALACLAPAATIGAVSLYRVDISCLRGGA